MRVVADISTSDILQVEKTPEIGDFNNFNGRFSVPVPDGAALTVTSASYILPQDGNDVASEAAAALLAQFPMYDNIAFNFLLEDTDIADLDQALLPAVSPIGGATVRTRAQMGRSAGPNTGMWPNMVAVLPVNSKVAPVRPGTVVTTTIDITAPTAGFGADEVLVWWHIYEFDTSHDIMSDFGGNAGANDPARKQIAETDQEADIAAYVSNDDGVTWVGPIGRLEPTDLTVFDLSLRLAFVNLSTTKVYLAAYAIMF